jgi:hypothetical protein
MRVRPWTFLSTEMHPRIQELIDYLDRERQYLGEVIAEFPAAHAETKPAPDVWSAADVVHHLAIIEQRIGALIAARIAEARGAGVAPDSATDPIVPTIRVSHILDRTQRIRNPRGDPQTALPMDAAIAALDQARRDFKATLRADDLPDLSQISAPHPAFGPLNGYEWVAFTAAHTRRHADQISALAMTFTALAEGNVPPMDDSEADS